MQTHYRVFRLAAETPQDDQGLAAAAGGVVGAPGRPGGSGSYESRPELEELGSGERVTEPGRPGAPTTTGPAAGTPPGAKSLQIVGETV